MGTLKRVEGFGTRLVYLNGKSEKSLGFISEEGPPQGETKIQGSPLTKVRIKKEEKVKWTPPGTVTVSKSGVVQHAPEHRRSASRENVSS